MAGRFLYLCGGRGETECASGDCGLAACATRIARAGAARPKTYPLTRPHRISFEHKQRVENDRRDEWCGAAGRARQRRGQKAVKGRSRVTDGARAAAAVGGLALLLQVIVLIVN